MEGSEFCWGRIAVLRVVLFFNVYAYMGEEGTCNASKACTYTTDYMPGKLLQAHSIGKRHKLWRLEYASDFAATSLGPLESGDHNWVHACNMHFRSFKRVLLSKPQALTANPSTRPHSQSPAPQGWHRELHGVYFGNWRVFVRRYIPTLKLVHIRNNTDTNTRRRC